VITTNGTVVTRKSRLALIALAAIGSVLFAPVISTAYAESDPIQTVDVYGGVIDADHPLHTADPYIESSTDQGVTWGPAYLDGEHPWGQVGGTNSWLNCGPSLSDCLDVRSDYRVRFHLDHGWSAASIVADMKMDNIGWLLVNGTDVSGQHPTDWNSNGPIDVTAMLHDGWNEVYAVLVDQGGLAGINFHLQISVTSQSPIALLPAGSPPHYQVGFDPGEVSDVYPNYDYVVGSDPITLPIPTKDGYTFKGWAKGSTDGLIIDSPTYTPDVDVTLFPIWAAIPPTMPEEPVSLADTGFDLAFPLALSVLSLGLGLALIRKTKRSH